MSSLNEPNLLINGINVLSYLNSNSGKSLEDVCMLILNDYDTTQPETKKKTNKGSKKITTKDLHIDCSICLEPLKLGFFKRTLECRHTFHKTCIDNWLTENNSCPYCRK